jgi:hypothetical protein
MSNITGTSLKDRIKALESAGLKDTLVKKRVPAYAAPIKLTQDNVVYETSNDMNSGRTNRPSPNINLVHFNHAGKSPVMFEDDQLLPRNQLLTQIRKRASRSPDSIENDQSRSMSRERNGVSPAFDGSQFASPNIDMKFFNDSSVYQQQNPDDENLNDLDLNLDDHQQSLNARTHEDHFYENEMDLNMRMGGGHITSEQENDDDDDDDDQDEVNSYHNQHPGRNNNYIPVEIIEIPDNRSHHSSRHETHRDELIANYGPSHGNHVIHLGSKAEYLQKIEPPKNFVKSTAGHHKQQQQPSRSGVSSRNKATKA